MERSGRGLKVLRETPRIEVPGFLTEIRSETFCMWHYNNSQVTSTHVPSY